MTYFDRALEYAPQLNRRLVQPWRDGLQYKKRLEEAASKYNEKYTSKLAVDSNNVVYFTDDVEYNDTKYNTVYAMDDADYIDAKYAASITYATILGELVPTIVINSNIGNVSPYIYLWRFDDFDQTMFERAGKTFKLTMDNVTNTYENVEAFLDTITYGDHWMNTELHRFDVIKNNTGHNSYWESHYNEFYNRGVHYQRRNPAEHRLLCADPKCKECSARGRIEHIVDIISGRDLPIPTDTLDRCVYCRLPHVYWEHGQYENGNWKTEPFDKQKTTTCADNEINLLKMEEYVRVCGACTDNVLFIRGNVGTSEWFHESLIDEHQRWHDKTKDTYTDDEIADFFPLAPLNVAQTSGGFHAFNILKPKYKETSDWFDDMKRFHANNKKMKKF